METLRFLVAFTLAVYGLIFSVPVSIFLTGYTWCWVTAPIQFFGCCYLAHKILD